MSRVRKTKEGAGVRTDLVMLVGNVKRDARPKALAAVACIAGCVERGAQPDNSAATLVFPEDDAPTLGLNPSRFGELYGIGSDMEPILMRHRPYDKFTQEFSLDTHSIRRVLERDTNSIDTVDYPLTFHTVSDEKALAYDPNHAQADGIEACVRPYGPRLVELFWRHIQPCFPLLHRGVFMQQYGSEPASESSSPTSRKRLGAELLGAVYLSALRWWTYDPELSIRPMPDATRLRRLLHEALRASYHRPRLSAIQAILLMLQCQPEDPLNPDHSYAWGLTCQALAVGQCLGLHLDASQWSIPAWERHLRKRLSWALFMQDRWTALAYGRPVHIHLDDWTVLPLTDADFADIDGKSAQANESTIANAGGFDDRRSINATGKTQFILMVQLAQILSTVLSSFYTARTSLDQDTVLLYQRACPLLDQLQSWYQSIPASLQMGVSYQRKLSFHGHLHFSYYGVKIALLRRLIRSTALPPRCADDQVLSELRQLALQTVQSAIAFTFSLRPDQHEAFCLVGSFTTLLLVTSLSSQERSFWQETSNSYLWHLRTMSKSSEPMRYAVNRLEGAILRGLEHALAVNLHEPVDDTVSPMMATDRMGNNPAFATYTDFGDWDLAASLDGAFDLLSAMTFVPLPGH
ncbi:hypothetical protein SEUCBS139899_008918 [Sporothrix eucalyptigena]